MKQIKNLTIVLNPVRSVQEMSELLYGLLQPNENLELSARLEIVQCLKKGLLSRRIAEDLNAGVSAMSRRLKNYKKKSLVMDKSTHNLQSWWYSARKVGGLSMQ